MKKLALILAILSIVMITPVSALAVSETETMTIVTQVPSSIDITAPDDISGWTLLVGDNYKTGTLSVACNTDWNVAVKDNLDNSKPSGSEGKMVEWDGAAYPASASMLTNALKLQVSGESEITLSGTDQNLWSSNQSSFSGDKTITFNQILDSGDSADPNYRIVITFVATTY